MEIETKNAHKFTHRGGVYNIMSLPIDSPQSTSRTLVETEHGKLQAVS